MTEGDDDQKRICCECVREAYLAQRIEKDAQAGECSYCGETLACITVEELADHVETAFADHYVRTANYPDSWQERAMADRESDYEWEREGQPVVEADHVVAISLPLSLRSQPLAPGKGEASRWSARLAGFPNLPSLRYVQAG